MPDDLRSIGIVLCWTLIVFFAILFAVTVAAITGRVRMEKRYRDQLFTALIIELITTVFFIAALVLRTPAPKPLAKGYTGLVELQLSHGENAGLWESTETGTRGKWMFVRFPIPYATPPNVETFLLPSLTAPANASGVGVEVGKVEGAPTVKSIGTDGFSVNFYWDSKIGPLFDAKAKYIVTPKYP